MKRILKTTVLCALAATMTACVSGSVGSLGGRPLAAETFDRKQNKRIDLPATLFLPQGTAKVPAMVIVHGSGGVTRQREGRYARELQRMGVAALVIDSFSPRGISTTVSDQGQISSLQMTVDAYFAAVALAKHPRINPAKIGVMGFSKGGTVSLYASRRDFLNRLKKRLPAVRPFALHVAFYPWCGNFWTDMRTTGMPVYALIGARDTYTGVEPCLEWVRRSRAAGADVSSTVYPGATHGWDGDNTWRLESGQNFSQCVFEQQADGSWKERVSGIQFIDASGQRDRDAYRRAVGRCMSRGVSGGLHLETKTRSMADLKARVRRHLLQ